MCLHRILDLIYLYYCFCIKSNELSIDKKYVIIFNSIFIILNYSLDKPIFSIKKILIQFLNILSNY